MGGYYNPYTSAGFSAAHMAAAAAAAAAQQTGQVTIQTLQTLIVVKKKSQCQMVTKKIMSGKFCFPKMPLPLSKPDR